MSHVYFHPIPDGVRRGEGLPTDVAIIANTGNRTRRTIVIGTDEQIALINQLAYSLGEGELLKHLRILIGSDAVP